MTLNFFLLGQRTFRITFTTVIAAVILLSGAGAVSAQTAAKKRPAENAVALEGYCPVCVIEMKRWVRGKPEHQASYDGKTYYFPSEKQKEMFLADSAKYTPALGGDCTVCLAKMGKRAPGDIRHAVLYDQRLFLFPSADLKKEFEAHPKQYVNVDLALDGMCAVCKVEINKDVPGKPQIAVMHQGLRYLFPAEKQREMFLADPDKYTVQQSAKQSANTHSSTQNTSTPAAEAQFVTIEGKSGCAACDHGVTPIGSPDELGLAVNAKDGAVYVVEDAHKLYPKVYEARFEGLALSVRGKVLKRDGNVAWIQPTDLNVIN